eukprot:TRINITY_DN19710_c0_g1_i1.p1 TRINITY_DN19710_c0_g1~~TRINITY_DN19710_c0_g1_i1.p1  ORF type:complete len:215 (-),score=55.52 TRINITY_DN19710_c0_g1_i1:211-855(-)
MAEASSSEDCRRSRSHLEANPACQLVRMQISSLQRMPTFGAAVGLFSPDLPMGSSEFPLLLSGLVANPLLEGINYGGLPAAFDTVPDLYSWDLQRITVLRLDSDSVSKSGSAEFHLVHSETGWEMTVPGSAAEAFQVAYRHNELVEMELGEVLRSGADFLARLMLSGVVSSESIGALHMSLEDLVDERDLEERLQALIRLRQAYIRMQPELTGL